MRRAFVNEDIAAVQTEQPVERLISTQPNYVTSRGLAQLQSRVAALQVAVPIGFYKAGQVLTWQLGATAPPVGGPALHCPGVA